MATSSSASKLGLMALRSMIVPLSVTLVLACILTVVVIHKYSVSQLDDYIQRLGSEQKPHIEELLWQFDIEGIKYQLQSFVDLDNVKYLRVTGSTGSLVEAGEIQPDLSIPRIKFPLEYLNLDGRIETIGSMTIHASIDGIWATVRRQVFALVFIYIAVSLIVSFLIMRQFSRNVLTPILGLADTVRAPPDDLRQFQIDLKRVSKGDGPDELDELVDAIHQMRDQILSTRAELQQGESRLAQAATLAGLGYCTYDASFDQIIDCNQNFADFHGKTIDEMRSLHVGEDIVVGMMNPEDVQDILQFKQQLMKVHRGSKNFQINVLDGGVRHIHQSFDLQFDNKGTMVAVDAVAQDVTDEIVKQEILVQSQKNEAVGKLTGGVAHDFNNILAVILGNVEIMVDKTRGTPLQQYGNAALQAVDQGRKLTLQLLSFARRQPLSPKVLDVAKLVRDSAMLLQTSLGGRIHLEIIADGSLWKTKADPVQLEAVILNLVVNARDAMREGGALTLEICNARLDHEYSQAHREVKAGNYVCLSVTDSGTGMSPDVVEQAIEPFFTTKEIGKGTGLGLSMAFGFAKQSGGHLKIYSELGYGTTVKLYLPKEHSKAVFIAPEITVESQYKLADLKVFLIEDNEELCQMFSEQLVSLGCIVHSAYDEASALKLASEVDDIDIILSDIIIPGALNGRELAMELSAFYPLATIVFMSGFTENSVVHNGRLDDGVVFLQKPFRLADLARVLTENTDSLADSKA